jgi:RNA polymerase sigma factor FliA
MLTQTEAGNTAGRPPVAAGRSGPDLPPAGRSGEAPRPVVAWHPDGLTRDEVVERYGHLIKYVVGRLGVSVSGVFDHEDAMQAGAIGLLQAIDNYRPDAAASFESYALVRIRGAILDAVRALDSVGRAGREAARAIQAAMRDLHEELGRPAEEGEVAERLGITVERYHERLAASSVVTVSLDETESRGRDEESATLGDLVVDERAPDPLATAEDRDQVERLAAAISTLEERQRLVLGLYYQDELTLREIGEVLGVTESRVCQIRSAAILALRGRLGAPGARNRPAQARTINRPAHAGRPMPVRPSLPPLRPPFEPLGRRDPRGSAATTRPSPGSSTRSLASRSFRTTSPTPARQVSRRPSRPRGSSASTSPRPRAGCVAGSGRACTPRTPSSTTHRVPSRSRISRRTSPSRVTACSPSRPSREPSATRAPATSSLTRTSTW